ncbi:DNA polymerase epsilon subunit 2-like isoform X2 [Artemia franciscana]|uniref:DNA polymerase epsilon subunit 2-like isoform X2 n=1 Tax=Artemia franciscana TaxID=6661 RepID=UPI0032DA570C
MSLAKIKNNVSMSFRLSGLNIKGDALNYLADLLSPVEPSEHNQWIERIIDLILKQGLTSPLVDLKHVEAAALECGRTKTEEADTFFNVISAYDVPHYVYVPDRKKYILSSAAGIANPSIYSDADTKGAMFRERYTKIQQRTARHELFSPSTGSILSTTETSVKFKMIPIEFLLGTTTKLKDVVVLGFLTQLKEGKFYLEDPTGSVPIDLSNAVFQAGLYTEGCFVLTEGWYDNGVYYVKGVGFPPPEPAKTTRAYFGNANFFGGPSQTTVKASAKLKSLEQANPDAMMIFLADVWLDQHMVLEKVRTLLNGYAELQPFAIVFMGDFLSSSKGSEGLTLFRNQFKKLGEMISEHPQLVKNTKFIFVPGPHDPGFPAILPRPPLPKTLTDGLVQKVPNAIFSTNPCRIQYGTREIVIFREDLVTRMCRNCLHFPSNSDIPEHGSFSRNQFSFKVYYPATGQVDDSQIEAYE